MISTGKTFFIFLLIAAMAVPALAQRGRGKQKEEPAYEPVEWIDWTGKGKPSSYLVIKVDTDCIITLDAGQGISVNADEEVYIWYPSGLHMIEAVSNDGTLTFREEKKIKKREQEFMFIQLNPEEEEKDPMEGIVNWDGREKTHATLNIESDTDCKITLDGKGEFRLNAGEETVVWYPKGKHLIEAVSLTGNLSWSTEWKMKPRSQKTLHISLNPPEQIADAGDDAVEGDSLESADQTPDVRIIYWDHDSPPYSTLNMKADSDCKVSIDGMGEFQLKVGEEVVVWFPKGKHMVESISLQGDLKWTKEIKMKKNTTSSINVELLSGEPVVIEDTVATEEDIYDQEEPFDMTILENMVLVESGEYMMGDKMGEEDEMPRHMVRVKDFYMDKYEVTNAEYARFLSERGLNIGGDTWIEIESEYCQIRKKGKKFIAKPGYENHPVVKVTWYGAEVYAEWAGKRLPTEAEWEYAARGGKYSQGFKYSGGDHLDVIAWFNNNALGETRPVGSKLPNELGIFDMTGNVWEWCQDYYGPEYYKSAPKDNPPGVGSGQFRVLRGGSAKGTVVDGSLRVANRNRNKPSWGNYLHGFRCVLDVPKELERGRR